MKAIIFLCVFVWLTAAAPTTGAQSKSDVRDYPVAGQPCPGITFKNLKYLPGVSSLEDLRGKWVILDFWTKGCSGCVATFPKLHEMQRDFGDKVRIVLVGNNDRRNKGIEAMYEKFRAKLGLELAVSFDSTLFDRFGIYMVPHVVIVAPSGMVHAVTYGDQLNAKSVSDLVNNVPHLFIHKPNLHEERVSPAWEAPSVPAVDQILSGSYFSKWHKSQPVSVQQRLDGLTREGVFTVQGVHLTQLYNYAYVGYVDWLFIDSLYGKWHRGLILETPDQSALSYDHEDGHGLYNYFLKPKGNASKIGELQLMLQQDLAKQFGYTVAVEEREMPVWILTATPEAKRQLATRSAAYSMTGDHAGMQFRNASLKSVLEVIRDYNHQQPPIVDQTGMNTNVDIAIDALMNDFNAVRESLGANGLTLTKSHRKMKVIVLREGPMP